MESASTPYANKQARDVILVHTVQLKPMIRAQISGRVICNGINDVVIVLDFFEKKKSEEVDYDYYYYYEFIVRNDGLWWAPRIDFRYETEARKVIVDFKFDALYM